MKQISKNAIRYMSVTHPTAALETYINYLPPAMQERLDGLVLSELGWIAARGLSRFTGERTRRTWYVAGRGIIGNMSAVRELQELGFDWRAVLLDEAEDVLRVAA